MTFVPILREESYQILKSLGFTEVSHYKIKMAFHKFKKASMFCKSKLQIVISTFVIIVFNLLIAGAVGVGYSV